MKLPRNPISLAALISCGVLAASDGSAENAQLSDACALLTPSEVSAALGITVEDGRRPNQDDPTLCNWREKGKPDGPARNAMVTVIDAQRFDAEKARIANQPPVSGLEIGDDAFFVNAARFPPNLLVKKGPHYVRIMARTQQPTSGKFVETAIDADQEAAKKLAHDILKKW